MQSKSQPATQRLSAAVTSAIAASRSTGTLNLGDRGLLEVPPPVYDPEAPLDTNVKWWEAAQLTKVDFARNALSSLPDGLCAIPSIAILDVSSNQLRQLPNNMPMLVNLKMLDVSKNKLAALPESLAEVTALVTLNFSDNSVKHMPVVLGQTSPKLAVLSASNNQLEALPSTLGRASSLTQLNLQGNRLTLLNPDVLRGLRSLQELNVSQNALTQLPADIGFLSSVRIMWLRENQLAYLPAEIAALTNLVELHMGFNKLTSLPPSLGLLTTLKVMDVRNNQLKDLPVEACRLQLTLWDLSNNNLSNLPPQLGLMSSLRSLPLDGNPIRAIRRELVAGPLSHLLKYLASRLPDAQAEEPRPQTGAAAPPGNMYTPTLSRSGSARPGRMAGLIADPALARSGNVFAAETAMATEMARKVNLISTPQELNLSSKNLVEVPDEVWRAKTTLWTLDLSNNKVGHIPSQELLGFTQLRYLALNGMGLTAWPLPAATNSLLALEELQARNNPFQFMPRAAFIACPCLKRLDLAGVLATALMPPQTMALLTRLETLNLSTTSAFEVPADVPMLCSLRTLNMSGNKLTDVPADMARLGRLEELDLSNNALVNLPAELGTIGTLRVLRLEGNPLKPIRRQILEKGTNAVMEYLRSKLPETYGDTIPAYGRPGTGRIGSR